MGRILMHEVARPAVAGGRSGPMTGQVRRASSSLRQRS